MAAVPVRFWLPRRFLRRTAQAAALALLFALVYLSTAGFPARLVSAFLGRLDTGIFAVEADGVRLRLPRGIAVDELRVYRKGVVGPPCGEARRVAVGLSLLRWLRRETAVERVEIGDAVARPVLLRGPPPPPARHRPMRPAEIAVAVRRGLAHGVEARDIAMVMRIRDYSSTVSDIRASLFQDGRVGTVSGRTAFDLRTRLLSGRLELDADPHMFLTALEDWNAHALAARLRATDFRGRARCALDFAHVTTEDQPYSFRGPFAVGECVFQGVEILRADGALDLTLSATNSIIAITSGLLVREEGIVRGGFVLRPRRKQVAFDVDSTIDPKALGRLAGVMTNDAVRAVSFAGPVRIRAQGDVDRINVAATRISARVTGKDLVVDKLAVDEWAFNLDVEGRKAVLTGIEGRLYGGPLWGDASLQLPAAGEEGPAMTYAMNLAFDRGNFAAMMSDLLGEMADYRGDFGGNVRAAGVAGAGQGKTVTGQGAFRIRHGRVFMLPVFGGLSDVMTRIIPGLEFVLRQSDATVNFDIADGKVQARKVNIEGDVLSLNGGGDYYFDKRVDFDVQLTLLREHTAVAKLLRMLTYPISKLLEFRLRGTFSEPVWYPVNFSKDLLDRLRVDPSELNPARWRFFSPQS
ncbi:MAG: hypothetical protein FJ225_06400 [Lentisphaerae bacterium]|nr:hypothetical protein [Lentisphaerota bacterium]